uniref:toll/interleukin-1 receptor domain-containing protein n=1 Tax=Elioraea sp. TaxID=2185103 RepID=UPI0025C5579A
MASDIFISYAREDRATAQSLADAFVAKGRSVWWDREIQGGSAFATEIEKALTGARLVVVLWS